MLGKALALGYLLMLGLGWVMIVWLALSIRSDDPIRGWVRSLVEDHARLAAIPFLLLLVIIAVFAVFERPFRFNAAEVEFLHAGPFSRRQAVTYKIGAEFSGLVLLTLVAAPLGGAIFPFLACFTGILLTLAFIHLFQLVVSSLGATLGLAGARVRIRLAWALAVITAAGALIWSSLGHLVGDAVALNRLTTQSMAWRIALSPLVGFFKVITARHVWPDLVQWAPLCLIIDGVLLATVYALDARLALREDEADLRALDADTQAPAAAPVRWSFPLSSLGHGAGTLAWRQAMNVIRGPRQIGFALFMHCVLLCAAYAIIRSGKDLLFLSTLDGRIEVNAAGIKICGVLAIMLTMAIASGLSFDFRVDIGRMDVLKALPMAPLAVVVGQLFVPVVIASILQWVLLVVISLALRRVPSELCVAAAFAPPASIVLMAIENLPSFWFPLRQTPGSKPEPFELFGHLLLHPFVRMLGYALAAGTTLLVSALAYLMFGTAAVAIIAAWLALAASGAGLVAFLSHTFDQLDVAQDRTAGSSDPRSSSRGIRGTRPPGINSRAQRRPPESSHLHLSSFSSSHWASAALVQARNRLAVARAPTAR
jgi:hypothetical protein